MARKTAAQLDQEIAEALARPAGQPIDACDPCLKAPHYYVFFYRGDQISGTRVLSPKASGWQYPKQYLGPFETMAIARAAVSADLKRSQDESDFVLTPKEIRDLRKQYKIRRLTGSQFKKIWGEFPGQAAA